VTYRERDLECESPRFDVIKPMGANVLARIVSLDRDYPAVTTHQFGAGTAIYVGLPAREELLVPIMDELIDRLAIKTGPQVPAGVMTRQITPTHILYLNLDGIAKRIELKGRAHSILWDQEYEDGYILGPFEPEFLEFQ
jgi:beta-galactosidase